MCMRRASAVRGALRSWLLATARRSPPTTLAVDVQNASEPTLCAEKDNVYLKLASPEVRRFKIEAVHPAYIGTIVVDRSAFDLHNCPTSRPHPIITEKPRRITIFETQEWQLIGLTIPNFWRKTIVPVRVGDRVETGVQLLQLWTRSQDRAEEVLVLYPQDGYWRARPLPPANLNWSAYGSSFLVGPVEIDGAAVRRHPRDRVRSDDAHVPPAVRARRRRDLAARDARHRAQVLDVTLDPPVGDAAVRGAALDVRHRDQQRRGASRLAGEGRAELGAQRRSWISSARARSRSGPAAVPSRHNTSAPDMVFRDFKGR